MITGVLLSVMGNVANLLKNLQYVLIIKVYTCMGLKRELAHKPSPTLETLQVNMRIKSSHVRSAIAETLARKHIICPFQT